MGPVGMVGYGIEKGRRARSQAEMGRDRHVKRAGGFP